LAQSGPEEIRRKKPQSIREEIMIQKPQNHPLIRKAPVCGETKLKEGK
jgi:hypothetical protein